MPGQRDVPNSISFLLGCFGPKVATPKRLRYFLHRDPGLVGRVLAVALRALETRLRECSPGAPTKARFGAVTFIQRFGSALVCPKGRTRSP